MAKIKMTDKQIADSIAEICYYPTNTKEKQAIQLFFEKICLPPNEKWYTIETMSKYIRYFLKHKTYNHDTHNRE